MSQYKVLSSVKNPAFQRDYTQGFFIKTAIRPKAIAF